MQLRELRSSAELLTISIPTYNRADFLRTNLEMLCSFIDDLDASTEVGIQVTDNASDDGTMAVVGEVSSEHPGIRLAFSERDRNLGVGRNILDALQMPHTPFVMVLGDDDYIELGYLRLVLEVLRSGEAQAVIPAYQNCTADREPLPSGRDLGMDSKLYPGGFSTALDLAWRGHQMSGIVVRTDILTPAHSERLNADPNPYPQVSFTLAAALSGPTLHLTKYPVAVTRLPKKGKDWGYGDDGLIQAIWANFTDTSGLSSIQVARLQVGFLDTQFWRWAMYLKRGPKAFLTVIRRLMTGENTITWLRPVIPLVLAGIALKKAAMIGISSSFRQQVKSGLEYSDERL